MLTNYGKKVLIIDSTVSEGIKYFFNYNQELETNLETPYLREDIDILIRGSKDDIDIQDFCKKYDEILIEADEECYLSYFNKSDNKFLVQNFDKEKLIKNKEIIEQLRKEETLSEINIIYNQILDCKLKKSYIRQFLNLYPKNEFEIYFNEEDLCASYNMKMDGRINLRRISADQREVLFDIASDIAEFEKDKKLFKKIAK